MLVSGQVGVDQLSGPVGVAEVMADTAKYSMISFFQLVAFISINLGVMNLLPLPALDGGRLVFLIIEGIRRKPVPPKYEGYVHAAGLMLLLMLMVYVTGQDVLRIFYAVIENRKLRIENCGVAQKGYAQITALCAAHSFSIFNSPFSISERGRGMKKTKQIKIRDVLVGGGAPIAVQSMTNTDTRDAKATLAQIRALADAGCDIVRCAVPDMQAAEALREICANSPLPVVADIHFDYRLALAAIESGVDKIRLNPGNIGGADRAQAVVKAARHAICRSAPANSVGGEAAHPREIRRPDTGSDGRIRAVPCRSAERLRF